MKDYNYHALFYYRVLGKMQDLRGGDGVALSDLYPKRKNEPKFYFAYERRPSFDFQYQREEFLVNRDRLVTVGPAGSGMENTAVMLRYDAANEKVTIYKRALRHAFAEDADNALAELRELLDKFYIVTVKNSSGIGTVDTTNNRHGGNVYVTSL